ncbi:MAG: MarR family transcriptional regulator, partial [Mesorhizobium sp.]
VAAHVANEHEILSGLTRTEQETLARLLEKLTGSVS